MYKRYWKINLMINGFIFALFVYGTEEQLSDYIETECRPGVQSYVGVNEQEIEYVRKLNIRIYMM